MIKNNFKISIIFLILTLSCYQRKENKAIKVNQLISDYNLESRGEYNSTGEQENKWFSKDSTLSFTLYENNKTNHFLYIVQNKNYDTVFKYFDDTNFNLKVREFFKTQGEYWIAFWNSPLEEYIGYQSSYSINRDIYTDLYTYDSLDVYLVDSISYKLLRIEKPKIEKIVNLLKKDIGLQGDFKPIKTRSKLILVKDTLDDHKIYYKADVKLALKKTDESFKIVPHFVNVPKKEIVEDNINYWKDYIGSTEEANIVYKYYYYYLDPADSSYSDNKKFNKIEIISYYNNKEIVITTLKEEDIYRLDSTKEEQLNTDVISGFRPDLFTYQGEYFFTPFLPYVDEFMEGFPRLYHLDTIDWTFSRVIPLKNQGKRYQTKDANSIKMISGDLKKRVSLFNERYKIIKINNEFRLIKKE